MVKKYLIAAIISATSFAFVPLVYASTISVSPSTITSTAAYAAANVLFNSDDNQATIYVFNGSNIGVNNNDPYPSQQALANSASPVALSSFAGLSSPLPNDSYTILTNGYGAGTNMDGSCGVGKSLATCEANFTAFVATNVFTVSIAAAPVAPIAPMNDTSSTVSMSALVYNEIVILPLYILKNYETPLVGMAIIITLVFSILGVLRWLTIL